MKAPLLEARTSRTLSGELFSRQSRYVVATMVICFSFSCNCSSASSARKARNMRVQESTTSSTRTASTPAPPVVHHCTRAPPNLIVDADGQPSLTVSRGTLHVNHDFRLTWFCVPSTSRRGDPFGGSLWRLHPYRDHLYSMWRPFGTCLFRRGFRYTQYVLASDLSVPRSH